MPIALLRAALLGTALLAPPSLAAQSQPPAAVNQQDEVVTININPGDPADRVLQILRSDDKAETNRYISRAFELRNTAAFEMRPIILDIIGREKGVLRGAKTAPTDGSRPREFLIVTTTPEQMPSVEETIRQIDVNGLVNSQGRVRHAVRVRYRRASDLARVLAGTRAGSQTRLFADDLTNTLYYDDSATVVRALEPYVAFYDIPAPQIEFDIQIIELRESDASRLGLDWDAWKRSIGGQFALTTNQFEGGESFARLDTLLTLDATVLANFLNYTVQSGTARLVQRSRLNASNLEPALISDSRRVTFHDYQRTERTAAVLTEQNPRVDSFTEYGPDEPPATAPRVVTTVAPVHNRLVPISEEHEGLSIRIQPVIGTETVTATIDIALNTLNGYDRVDRPIVTVQRLQNLFTLHNGEQILLGTLERNTLVTARRGIPGLKDIPVLQYLFSVESQRTERGRLFILATPTFSNVRLSASTLSELNEGTPALTITPRSTPTLEDGRLEQLLEGVE
jgi:type II secretory pathway component GspD/PulD (secretin)